MHNISVQGIGQTLYFELFYRSFSVYMPEKITEGSPMKLKMRRFPSIKQYSIICPSFIYHFMEWPLSTSS